MRECFALGLVSAQLLLSFPGRWWWALCWALGTSLGTEQSAQDSGPLGAPIPSGGEENKQGSVNFGQVLMQWREMQQGQEDRRLGVTIEWTVC